jgi:hypothetical protein
MVYILTIHLILLATGSPGIATILVYPGFQEDIHNKK